MFNTLILTPRGRIPESIADIFGMILGPVRHTHTESAALENTLYDLILIIAPIVQKAPREEIVLDAQRLKAIQNHASVAALVLTDQADPAIAAEAILKEELGERFIWFSSLAENPSRAEIVHIALDLKRQRDALSRTVPPALFQSEASAFLQRHTTCTLCSGHADQVRATPIEYTLHRGSIYLLSEGGEKFAHILLNPRVSLAIYDEYHGMESLAGMQIQGSATIIFPSSPIYERILHTRGISKDRIDNLGFSLYLIQIIPEKIEFLNSRFRSLGYDTRQTVQKDAISAALVS